MVSDPRLRARLDDGSRVRRVKASWPSLAAAWVAWLRARRALKTTVRATVRKKAAGIANNSRRFDSPGLLERCGDSIAVRTSASPKTLMAKWTQLSTVSGRERQYDRTSARPLRNAKGSGLAAIKA